MMPFVQVCYQHTFSSMNSITVEQETANSRPMQVILQFERVWQYPAVYSTDVRRAVSGLTHRQRSGVTGKLRILAIMLNQQEWARWVDEIEKPIETLLDTHVWMFLVYRLV